MGVNTSVISGNVGANAEVRGGGEVLSFRLAHNERWTDRDGTARERVTWLTCALFGEARVRALAPRITKGARLTVCGALRGNTYEVDGVKHEGLQLIVDGIELPPLDRDDARDDDARDNPAQDAPRDQRAQGHRAARGGRR